MSYIKKDNGKYIASTVSIVKDQRAVSSENNQIHQAQNAQTASNYDAS